MKEELFAVLAAMGDAPKDLRDRALLVLGFAGGFRRSELVALDCADIEPVRQGLVVHVRRSKTDQEGAGRKVGIPHGRTRWCPVAAMEGWLGASGIEDGPLFIGVNRHGRVLDWRMSGEAVSLVIKQRVAAVGLADQDHRDDLINYLTCHIASHVSSDNPHFEHQLKRTSVWLRFDSNPEQGKSIYPAFRRCS